MSNKTIITFGFCDILNNQGLGKCYQAQPSAWLMTLSSTFIILLFIITLEALLTDTLSKRTAVLTARSQNPVFLNSHTNSVLFLSSQSSQLLLQTPFLHPEGVHALTTASTVQI